jgi:hypothetical protein
MAIKLLPKIYNPNFSTPNRKPIGEVELDFSSSLAHGLHSSYILNEPAGKRAKNLVNCSKPGELQSLTNVVSKTSETGNRVLATNTSSDGTIKLEPSPFIDTNDSFAYVCRFKFISGSSNHIIFGNRYGGSSNPLHFVKLQPQGLEFYNRGGISHTITPNVWHTVIINKNGNQLEYFDNGTSVGSTSVSGSMPPNPIGLGGDTTNSSERTESDFEFFHTYNRALTSAEIQAFQNDAYQLVKPVQAPVYFTASAAAPTSYYLDFTSTAQGVTLDSEFSPTNKDDWIIEVSLRTGSSVSIDQFVIGNEGSQSDRAFKIFISDSRFGSIYRSQWTGAGFLEHLTTITADTDYLVKVEMISGVATIYVDAGAGYTSGQAGTRDTGGKNPAASIGNGASGGTAWGGRLYYAKLIDTTTASNTRNLDSTASGGTGLVLPDIGAANIDGTLNASFSSPSCWVSYSSGTTISVTESGPSFTDSISTNVIGNITASIIGIGPSFTDSISAIVTSAGVITTSILESGPSFTDSIASIVTGNITASIASNGPSFTDSITVLSTGNITTSIVGIGPSFTDAISITSSSPSLITTSIIESGPSFSDVILVAAPTAWTDKVKVVTNWTDR